MTAEVLIASAEAGVSEIRHHNSGISEDAVPLKPYFISRGCPLRISRKTSGRGFIINSSDHVFRMEYQLKEGDVQVGPRADYIPPGGCKEIGAGPGVDWLVH